MANTGTACSTMRSSISRRARGFSARRSRRRAYEDVECHVDRDVLGWLPWITMRCRKESRGLRGRPWRRWGRPKRSFHAGATGIAGAEYLASLTRSFRRPGPRLSGEIKPPLLPGRQLGRGDDAPRYCHRDCHSTAATACNWPILSAPGTEATRGSNYRKTQVPRTIHRQNCQSRGRGFKSRRARHQKTRS
jgi:hypothetical protein